MIVPGFLARVLRTRARVVSGTPSSSLFRTYAGSNGGDTGGWSTALGFKFTVASGKTLYVTGLGCFASGASFGGGEAPPAGTTITASIASVADPTTILATVTFDSSSYGTLDTATRTLMKAVAVTLGPGDYYIWTWGYGASGYRCHATDSAQPPGTAPVSDGISGVTREADGDYYGFGTGAATNKHPSASIRYGGPTFEGYTV